METKGSKYDRSLNIVEIAKLVRGEIKAAIKSGAMPACKVSVRSDKNSLRVEVTEVPAGFVICSPERVRHERDYPYEPSYSRGRFTPEAQAVREMLQSFMDAYNRDNSDIMTDYFDVNFYGHAEFNWELEAADKARTLASFEAPVAEPVCVVVPAVAEPSGKVWAGYAGWIED